MQRLAQLQAHAARHSHTGRCVLKHPEALRSHQLLIAIPPQCPSRSVWGDCGHCSTDARVQRLCSRLHQVRRSGTLHTAYMNVKAGFPLAYMSRQLPFSVQAAA
jgi:hypothetical protein